MADWYVSSAAYAGYTAFSTTTYSVGALIVPTAPALGAKWVFRCTTAGLSTTEPTWNTANNGTSTSGAATFTNVTGQSTFFWTAAAGDLTTLLGGVGTNRLGSGDRVFLSSDHTETQTSTATYGSGLSGPTSFSVLQFLSVNRAGSTPPVAADLLAGATCICTGGSGVVFQANSNCFHSGITYKWTGAFTGITWGAGSTNGLTHYFSNCLLWMSNANSGQVMGATSTCKVVFDNTQIQLGNVGQSFFKNASATPLCDFTWQNTAVPVNASGSTPTIMFSPGGVHGLVTCRGVDFSAITGTLVTTGTSNGCKYLFDSCKIASGVTRYVTSSIAQTNEVVELVNCYNGSVILSERYAPAGSLTTDTTNYLTGGAADNVGNFSHKLVSGTNIDKFDNTMDSFWLDVNNTLTTGSHTATVEIVSSGSLNNDEISLWLEYEGTTGSSLASGANSFIATPLTTPAAVATSTASWASPPATPAYQHLQVTFSPAQAGRVRGQVRLGKPSTTVWINPQITIT